MFAVNKTSKIIAKFLELSFSSIHSKILKLYVPAADF